MAPVDMQLVYLYCVLSHLSGGQDKSCLLGRCLSGHINTTTLEQHLQALQRTLSSVRNRLDGVLKKKHPLG